jgi:hypothetical protein
MRLKSAQFAAGGRRTVAQPGWHKAVLAGLCAKINETR